MSEQNPDQPDQVAPAGEQEPTAPVAAPAPVAEGQDTPAPEQPSAPEQPAAPVLEPVSPQQAVEDVKAALKGFKFSVVLRALAEELEKING